MSWRRRGADAFVRAAAKSRVGLALLAWLSRHTGRTSRIAPIGEVVFAELPHSGRGRASFGRSRVVKCEFSTMYDRSVYSGREERAERELVDRLLWPGAVFVDAGANIGLLTVFGAAAVGRTGRVYAFEAVPSTATRLRASIAASRFGARVQVVEHAASDTTGTTVELAGHSHNTNRIASEHAPFAETGSEGPESERPASGATIASTIRLDDAIAEHEVISGIKIDVDGHELQVLRGAERVLRRDPWILIEFNSYVVGVRTLGDWDVHQHLTALGYTAYRPHQVLAGKLSPVPEDWSNPEIYVNLVYWRGPVPRPLDPRAERTRSGRRVAKHGPVVWPKAIAGARVVVASRLDDLDGVRKRLDERIRPSRERDATTASPTAVMAAVVHWRHPDASNDRLGHVKRVVDSLLAIDVDSVTVAVLSNDAPAAARDIQQHLDEVGTDVAVRIASGPRDAVGASVREAEVVVVPWGPGLVRRHGLYMPWAHVPVFREAVRKRRYSHLVYLEDDILFTDAHLRYWCTHRGPLAALGLIPGFLRFETKDGERFAVDQGRPVDPSKRRVSIDAGVDVPCHDFVNIENPHQGMYVIDQALAESHFRFSPSRSPFRSLVFNQQTGWGLCERASAGPHYDEVPRGMATRNVIPVRVTDDGLRVDPAGLVEHISATYAANERSPFGKVPLDGLFAVPEPAGPAPVSAG